MKNTAPNTVRTLTECYAHFGIEIRNPRSAWSAQAPNGDVVVTLWTQHFTDDSLKSYSTFGTGRGRNPPALRKRTQHLIKVGVGGWFDSIIIKPSDVSESTWRIVNRQIGQKMILTRLDEVTGEFTAELAGG